MATKSISRESKSRKKMIITRKFNAPREHVWKFWTEPDYVMKWWGPKNFTSPHCKIDLQKGGSYLFCMRSPDGKDFWSTGKFLKIKKPEKIIFSDSFADANGNVVPASFYGMEGKFPLELKVTVSLTDDDGNTLMVLEHDGLPEGQIMDQTKAGWNESFDKLVEVL